MHEQRKIFQTRACNMITPDFTVTLEAKGVCVLLNICHLLFVVSSLSLI